MRIITELACVSDSALRSRLSEYRESEPTRYAMAEILFFSAMSEHGPRAFDRLVDIADALNDVLPDELLDTNAHYVAAFLACRAMRNSDRF